MCLSVCLPAIYLARYLCFSLSCLVLSVCLSVCLSAYLSMPDYKALSVNLPANQALYLSISILCLSQVSQLHTHAKRHDIRSKLLLLYRVATGI